MAGTRAADTATIIVGAALFALTSVLVVYAWWNRKYQPIRAKNLPQTTVMLVCGAVWFVGNIAANGHVSTVGVWSKCRIWRLWIRLGFEYLFFCCVLARILALYWLFVRRRKFYGWSSFTPFVVFIPFVVGYCLVGQLVSPNVTVRYDSVEGICLESRAFRFCGIGLLWVVWILVIVSTWLARNIQSSFNEACASMLIVAAMLVSLLTTTVEEAMYNPIARHVAARVVGTLTDTIVANLVIWVVLAHPVYQSLFNRKRYSAIWRTQLVSEGFRRDYGISMSTVMAAGSVYSVSCSGGSTLPCRGKGSGECQREPSWIYRHSLPVRFSQTFGKTSMDTVPSLTFSNSTICASATASWPSSPPRGTNSSEIPRAAIEGCPPGPRGDHGQ